MKQVCIRCVVRLALCFRSGHCKSHILPPAVDPQRSPKRGRITRKQVQPTGAASREQSRRCWSIPEAASHYPAPSHLLPPHRPSSAPRSPQHRALSTARPAGAPGDTGCSASQGLGLQGAAVLANRAGGSPAATQGSGTLQTMAARAPHTSLSKEPCFWIIYATFRWKYFVFYSVDAFFFSNEALIKTSMCVILSGKCMLKCHFEYEIIHFRGLTH